MEWKFFVAGCLAALSVGAAEFPALYNTQQEFIPFTSPEKALAGIHLPEGFKATLFAAEPNVQQPINIATDSRGRLWVAECYTYAENERMFDTKLRDRILILEDGDGDGRFDKRTVFWDQGVELTSMAPGFGGVFALCPPKLLFIPDRNGDDVPDAEPEVLLDGFDATAARHNIANGLHFGPDGWLYGRHGILATSKVGRPGDALEKRANVNACIWRYHPVTHKFEVVAEGTTNPWGDDWDENGEHFFINTVIGHLWHVIPGAYYKRMYGEHPNPYLYELIDQTADHFHWDTREVWSDIRKLGVTPTTDQFGGGHAHSGFMIYLGDNWPERYRNTAFTINYHGRRLNNDRLERSGATYVGKHNPDLGHFDDPWFRGVELTYGPDGGVYIADWSDIGECHDADGIHRTSGRIYKITYGDVKPWKGDLRADNDAQLAICVNLNEWSSRQARLILEERFANRTATRWEGQIADSSHFPDVRFGVVGLRTLWLNYVTHVIDEPELLDILRSNSNEHKRAWAVRLLVDQGAPTKAAVEGFVDDAAKEKSGLVLTYVASAMRKAAPEQKWEIARALVAHEEFAGDPVFPLMVWYGIQPEVPNFTKEAVALAETSKLPKVRTFIARRIFEDLAVNAGAADQVVQLLPSNRSADFQVDILTGMDDALKGVQKSIAPAVWKNVAPILEQATDKRVIDLFTRLNALFGDGRAMDALRAVVADPKVDLGQRRRAFATLLQARAANLLPLIVGTLSEIDMAPDAIRGLATLGDAATPDLLIPKYNDLKSGAARAEAINTLVSRPAFAARLLEAVQRGQIKRADISAAQLRQLRGLNDKAINEKLGAIWPQLDESSGGKKQAYARWKKALTPERVQKADVAAGRAVFQSTCAVCHTLYGEGAKIGPDLTGSDRRNLDYLLENILNPSAIVPEAYRVSTIEMKDDRVITGIILSQTERALTVQTTTEKLVLEKAQVQSTQTGQLSMMPDGLIDALSEEQVANLFGYLMSQR